MKLNLIFLVFCFHKLVAQNHRFRAQKFNERIFKGLPAVDGQFPYMVLILFNENGYFSWCSGGLITDSLILLAAHCFKGYTDARLVICAAGKANLNEYTNKRLDHPWDEDLDERELGYVQERRGLQFYVHPLFDKSFVHDLALLRVARPFKLSGTVQTRSISTDPLKNGSLCSIQGFGYNSQKHNQDTILRYGEDLTVLTDVAKCGLALNYSGRLYCMKGTNYKICKGDSGAPMVCSDRYYAVTSHHLIGYATTCGSSYAELFAVLTEKTNTKWIKDILTLGYNIPARGILRDCVTNGYGLHNNYTNITDYHLRYSIVDVNTSLDDCNITRAHKEWFYCMIYSESKQCSGDSGGPLICNNQVYGVISHNQYKSSEKRRICGESFVEYIAVVKNEMNWFRQAMGYLIELKVNEDQNSGEKLRNSRKTGFICFSYFLSLILNFSMANFLLNL